MNYPCPFRFVAKLAAEASGGDDSERIEFYDALFGMSADWSREIPLGREAWCPTTPPELIPIADYGVDGAHAGLVIHAPELERDDFPVGCYCEIDRDGVAFGGRDARRFMEMRLSACLRCWDSMGREDPDDLCRQGYGKNRAEAERFAVDLRKSARQKREKYAPYIELIAKELDIRPVADMKIFGWGTDFVEMPAPAIPDGWHYMRTPDRVGILARKELFDPSYRPELDDNDPLRSARLLGRRGFPATAMFVLKRAAWQSYPDEVFGKILEEMSHVYRELGRPTHAGAADASLALFRKIDAESSR